MKRVIVQVWVNGKRKKDYLEYFHLDVNARTREQRHMIALNRVRTQYGRFYPIDAIFKVKGTV